MAWWWSASDAIAREGGPVENLQLVILFATVVLFARHGHRMDGAGRRVAIALCLACMYLFLRELDLRYLQSDNWIVWLTTGARRKVMHGTVVFLLAAYVVSHFMSFWKVARSLLSWHAWPYYAAAVLFLVAKLAEEISKADKNPFGQFALPHGQFFEELLELNADMMLLVGAVMFYSFGTILNEAAERRTLTEC